MLLDLIRNGLRVSLLHISAVIYGDEFVIFRNDRLHEFAYHVGNIGSGVCNGAIVQANDIAGLNVHAIPFAVPYGIGNHACLHPLCSFLHALGVFLAAHLRLESDSCCNAHGNVLRGNDVNFLFGQFRRLLRSKHHIAVIGEYKHAFGVDLVDGLQNIFNGRIHGLATLHNMIHGEITEDL